MEVLKLEAVKLNNEDVLKRVIRALREGEVVCAPTDTVYGLLADAMNEKAVQKIFQIKRREEEKPLPWFVSGVWMAREYAEIGGKEEQFLKKAWPGAVTAVFRARRGGTIGLRAPKDEFLQSMLREMGMPLAQTSANISGKPPARSAKMAFRYFVGQSPCPALLVDGGERKGEASTVIDLTGGTPRILREGVFPVEAVFRLFRDSGL